MEVNSLVLSYAEYPNKDSNPISLIQSFTIMEISRLDKG